MNFEVEYIEKLAKLINKNNLNELVLEDGEKAIMIKRGVETVVQTVGAPMAPVAALPATAPAAAIQTEATEPKALVLKGTAITSPMVGAFYIAPSPGAKPFVKVGDTIAVGQVVCIVEAMKLMNEIEAEVSGKVTEICVEDGQSVEYGQVLMYVE